MTNEVRPDEAAGALTEIARRREQVVTLTIIPAWFWWATAVLMVGFTVAVETQRPLVIGIATAAFVFGILIVTGQLVLGIVRRAQPRNDLIGPTGVVAILGFVASTLAVSLPTSFALKAAGVRYAASCGHSPGRRMHGRRRAIADAVPAPQHAQESRRRLEMIKPKFDELIHAPTRLSIVSLLAATEWADFKFIRDSIGLSDSALSKQLTTLEDAGYVEIRKGFVGKRPRTSARLTSVGQAAFDQHVIALQEIVARAGASVLPR